MSGSLYKIHNFFSEHQNFLFYFMQFFSADATMFLKFLPTKSWKNHPQKLVRIPQIHFFFLLPWLPIRPKKKNSRSKMWPIDQLYIELGLQSQYIYFLSYIHFFIAQTQYDHKHRELRIILVLKYGFCKKYFNRYKPLTNWTLFSPVFFRLALI